MNKKILLTGALGQLGCSFKKLFNSLNLDYIETDYKNLDVTDSQKVEKFFIENRNISHVINCAAYNDVDSAEKDARVKLLNIQTPEILAKASKKINAIFITFSTDFVFDGEKGKPYTEEDIPNPLSEYGKSKLEGEKKVLEAYKKSFIIRTSWLFGIGNNNFCKQIINWSKLQEELKIVKDQISAPTYSEDLALFSWRIIETGKYGLYHISNGGTASKYQQAEYILKKINWKGKLIAVESKEFKLAARRPKYSKLSSEKVENLLKMEMPSWEDAIDRFILEMRERREL